MKVTHYVYTIRVFIKYNILHFYPSDQPSDEDPMSKHVDIMIEKLFYQ